MSREERKKCIELAREIMRAIKRADLDRIQVLVVLSVITSRYIPPLDLEDEKDEREEYIG